MSPVRPGRIALLLPSCLATICVISGDLMPTVLASPLTAAASEPLLWQDLVRLFGPVLQGASASLESAYERAPLIVIALVGALSVPLLAMLGWLFVPRSLRPPAHPVDSSARAFVGHSDRLVLQTAISPRPFALGDTIVRIGSHADNDLHLVGDRVADFHALLHPTGDGRFVIVDLTEPLDASVRVNGEAVAQCELRAGDQIVIGSRAFALLAETAAPAVEDEDDSQVTTQSAPSKGDDPHDGRQGDTGRRASGRQVPRIAA